MPAININPTMTSAHSGDAAPTVAVIIPFYNGAHWVERAIRSVVAQTVQPDEFVIVDDGSKPEESLALEQLSQRYPFRIISKKNGGQGSARNAGVAATTSSYISLLDQDDFYLPNHIKDLVNGLPEDDPRLGYVYADLCEADGAGNIIHSNMLSQQKGAHPKRGKINDLLRNDMFVLPSASLIKRSAFEAVSGFDEQFMGYEDDDLFLRLYRAGYTNYFLEEPVTVWCIHTGSTSWSVKMSISRFKYFKKLTQNFQNDVENHRFYFRDCLVPRFGRAIMLDALRAAKANSKDRAEVSRILREYTAIVCARSDIALSQKIRLYATTTAMTRLPSFGVRWLSMLIRKTPGSRRIASKMLDG